MGSGKLPDFEAERPPDLAGVPILGRIADFAPPAGLRLARVELAFGQRSRSRLRVTAQWLEKGTNDACAAPPNGADAAMAAGAKADRADAQRVTEVVAGIVLPRGSVLRGGAWVHDDQMALQVLAADEDLLEVSAGPDQDDPHLALLRAAYHLGNRHVALQIVPGVLKLEYDYVLSDMLVGMGLKVQRRFGPFEPEWGAYAAAHGH